MMEIQYKLYTFLLQIFIPFYSFLFDLIKMPEN